MREIGGASPTLHDWIPAFAGMTNPAIVMAGLTEPRHPSSLKLRRDKQDDGAKHFWIPHPRPTECWGGQVRNDKE
ncbi:MAG: hypothetical protein PHY02_01595 [Phycisphaerae bacterium]|nr:hypothetical protein [Phycisphaerae bacterium]